MISDFITLDKKSKRPLYTQIYRQIKNAIESGNLKDEEKLPSVRRLCADLGVSKTTVETAYNALCAEGYLTNQPQRGYFVEKGLTLEQIKSENTKAETNKTKIYKYDFSGKGIDNQISNLKDWRKYVKDILNKEYLLNTYSENQGEAELRRALAKYAFATRGVNTNEEKIIIASGSQSLIYILCGLLGIGKTVAIEQNSFPQAEQVFRDFNYNIRYTDSDSKGITVSSLKEIKPDIILLNTNFISENGSTMPVTRKLEILSYAKNNGALIIEDDYNGEMRYKTHPKASLQSYSNGESVYIGSFSKILLPSVRISYICLPDKLIKKYMAVKQNYNQTTSKTEQLALARYISDGKLEKHLRKSRRYYGAKSEVMKKSLKKHFNNFIFNETAMYFELRAKGYDREKSEVRLMSTSTDGKLRLNFSQINTELIEPGVNRLAKEIAVE